MYVRRPYLLYSPVSGRTPPRIIYALPTNEWRRDGEGHGADQQPVGARGRCETE